MNVREARVTDILRMAELFSQLGYATTPDQLERRWLDPSMGADTRAFVAEDGGEVIAVLILNFISPFHEPRRWAVISALVVDASIRSKGAGAMLLEHAEKEAMRQGCAHIELSSNESRTRAHQFYLRHGFIEARKRFIKRYAG
jgi:GNAT superfamily N-acetyltransferase